jgi:outer membrane lipoprotein carrier protein
MNLISRLCVCLGLLAFSWSAQADKGDAEQLRFLLDTTSSLQGEFVQTLYDNQGVKLDESRGSFVLQKPGNFYWKTREPYEQLLVSDQKNIWLYDPDLEQVTVRAVGEDLQQTPALLFGSDLDKLREQFDVSLAKAADQKTFTLSPKTQEGLFQKLLLVFAKDQLREFRIQDNLNQSTHFLLLNTRSNQPVDAALFNFVPPEGVDVLYD